MLFTSWIQTEQSYFTELGLCIFMTVLSGQGGPWQESRDLGAELCFTRWHLALGTCGPSFLRFLQYPRFPPETLEKPWFPPRCYTQGKWFNALRTRIAITSKYFPNGKHLSFPFLPDWLLLSRKHLKYPFHTLSSVNKLITSLFSMSVSLFFTLFIIYIGSIVALQCCVSSRCTTKSFS